MATETPFTYRKCLFLLRIEQRGTHPFWPSVRYVSGMAGVDAHLLPVDTDAYGTAAEARRHAEKRATHWVKDKERALNPST